MADDACVLPSVQIDTWAASIPVACGPGSQASVLVRALLSDPMLVALSLLHSTGAETCAELAQCIGTARGRLCPRVDSGQFYMTTGWRVRHEHMSQKLQQLVIQYRASTDKLSHALNESYDASKIEQCIYYIIGQARSQGVQALLPPLPLHDRCR